MHQKIKEDWIKALTSGEYIQARGTLKCIEDGAASYCCLGVLCELAHKEGIGEWNFGWPNNYIYQNQAGVISNDVKDWSGLPDKNGSFGPQHEDCLTILNDSGKTFEEIAEIIKEHF